MITKSNAGVLICDWRFHQTCLMNIGHVQFSSNTFKHV